ncbi:MAG: hypothetical protein JWL64_2411, partial [Frankiales bacterium]|nr:hypothetical protein [Frankiales bacterium]
MLWTAWQGLRAHRFRLFATALAISLGVAFTAGTFILTDTVNRTFKGIFGDVYAGTDAVVRGQESFDGPLNSGVQRPRVDGALVDVVRAVPGVEVAEGRVLGYARLVGKDGKALGDPANAAPTLGYSWNADARLNPFELAKGRAPRAPDEVVIDVKSSADGHLAIGDTTTVLVQGPPQKVTVVGTATFGGADSPGGATVVAFREDVAQRLIAEPGKYDEISVRAAAGVSQRELTTRIAAVLPQGTQVVTGAQITKENQDLIAESLGFFSTFMLIFAVVALLVGAFMIFNTFSITVAQRTQENGLLRALGASRRQVLSAVLLEALVVGVLASLLGLAAGLGVAAALKALLEALGFGIPASGLVFALRTVVVSLLAGIGITLLAALSPARKAAKIPPVAAMQATVLGSTGYGSRSRVVVGALVLTGGIAALFVGLFSDLGNPLPIVGAGALAIFFGVSILARTISLPLSRVIGAPLPRLRGVTGELARENAMRNPKRTAASASALMIGVGLVSFITIFVASTKASVAASIERAFTADLVLDSGASFNGGVDPGLADRLAALPEVSAATGLRIVPAVVGGDVLLLGAVDPATAFDVLALDPQQGRPADLDVDGIAVYADTARDKGLELGDTLPVRFRDTGEQTMTVAMIYGQKLEANAPSGTYFIGRAAYEANSANRFDYQVYVKGAPGTALADVRSSVDEVLAAYPGVDAMDKSGFADSVS